MKNEVIIDGITYIPKQETKGNIKIAILQRGWVMIGRYERDGSDCKLTDAHVIRSWGTTNGLGQLALEGKQPDTKLDKAGTVSFDILTIVALIDCKEDLWKTLL